MALAFANAVRSSGSDINWQFGTFTSVLGDGGTAATLSIGGRVLYAWFTNTDADSDESQSLRWSLSQSATTGITTVSVYSNDTITAGRYVIAYR